MEIVLIKDIAEVMGLDAKQVDHLPESRIDFLCWHVYSLSPTKAEPTDCRDFINCIYWKHLVDKCRFLESSQKLLNCSCLIVHLLLRILLQVELLFKLIELGPKLLLFFFDVDAISLKVFDLCDLGFFLIVNFTYLRI